MKKLSVIIAAVLFSFGVVNATVVVGDDTNEASHAVSVVIPKVALVDIEGIGGEAGSITLQPSLKAMEAGDAVDFSAATNSEFSLNFTSIVGKNETRSVDVSLSNELPAGVSLSLKAGAIQSGAVGTVGAGQTINELSMKSGQSIVTGIGSAYTGNGNKAGYPLTYTLNVDDSKYATLQAQSIPVTVTYTITGDAANIEK